MKSHDLANALTQLSKLLKSSPNIEMSDLNISPVSDNLKGSGNLAIGLQTLVNLSRIDKSQWIELIIENGFPITFRPRDASRDILGKLLKYLESNSAAREKLRQSIEKRQGIASPELLKAFGTLLKE